MKPSDYNLSLTVFFITYSIFGKISSQSLANQSRGSFQRLSQISQTPYLASHYNGHMGWNAALDGLRQNLTRIVGLSHHAWYLRSRTLSRSQLLSFLLVQAK